jgi:pyruvate/2-oxoglutarate dehydrogenase complex dihydrolipoamide acyltransferase (E2) component
VPTVEELRALASEHDVSLAGVRNKSEIEDRLREADVVFDETDDDEADEPDVPEEADEATAEVDEGPDIVERAYLAGYGKEIGRLIAAGEGGPGVTDFEMPDRASIPRMVRQMRYAECEAYIRAFTFQETVMVPETVTVKYDLPEGHGLSGMQLQDLFVAIAEAQENGEGPPDWETFK